MAHWEKIIDSIVDGFRDQWQKRKVQELQSDSSSNSVPFPEIEQFLNCGIHEHGSDIRGNLLQVLVEEDVWQRRSIGKGLPDYFAQFPLSHDRPFVTKASGVTSEPQRFAG